MSIKRKIAIVGATGAIGKTMLQVLHERRFPIAELVLLASERSVGQVLSYGRHELEVEDLAKFDFTGVDIALFSAGGAVSKQYAPIAAKAGAVVIDNTACFRYDDDIPLIIPEVNPEDIALYKKRGIIANPNCSTIQMLVALKPIYDAVGIKRINVATYQAVSGSGQKGIRELIDQLSELLNGRSVKPEVYPHQIAFNVLPHIDEFQDNAYTKEEMKMVWETQKIFHDTDIKVNPTAVRVPVLYGHSEAINIELKSPLSAQDARALLEKAAGVVVFDEPKDKKYPLPLLQATGHDEVFVGRIRNDISHDMALNLWVVADNTRKGAATNAIQIAEILHQHYL
ncbi:MAG: aspartate-semialdehyde dehydrogenase [Gammaproteobacteria bacterium]|nr:aspartate-semialdehyde dehydrogenase [Gammaproteobacteria bacterium]